MTIRTCFFDMGNVLVYFSHDRMCENIANVCGTDIANVREKLMTHGLQNEIECGRISEQQFHAELESHVDRPIDFDDLMTACADIFWLNESIVPLISELKRLDVRLVLLSNTSVTHLNFIRKRFTILDDFDELTTSFGAGAQKPDDQIYKDALCKADCSPTDCFYTDDIETYVHAARAYGIHAEVYSETSLTRKALRDLGVDVSLSVS